MTENQKAASDFSLTIDGVVYPFMLAVSNGQKQWNDGLAPMLAPQVRTGGFGYEHIPPDIEVITSFEDFSQGCGFEHLTPTVLSPLGINQANDPKGYNFTHGIDLSWGEKWTVALQRRSSTAVLAAPVKFLITQTLGLFAICGTYIYKFDLPSNTWVLKDDASADGAAYTDIIELNGVIYAGRVGGVIYKYSADGATWTAFTDSGGEYASYFTTRGNSSDLEAVWKINVNVLKATTNGQNGGVAWAGADGIGGNTETVRGMVTVNNTIFVAKNTGMFIYDGAHIQDLWKTTYSDPNNGKNLYLWADGNLYVTYGRRLLQLDPYTSSGNGNPFEIVFPLPGMDSLDILGDITAVGGNDSNLYIAVKNAAGNTHILKGKFDALNGWAWHDFAYLGANDCTSLACLGPGSMHTTNPVLAFGYGTAIDYIVLPKQGLHPNEDPACTFETTEGVAYFPYVDYGAKTFPKFLNRGAVLGTTMSYSRYAKLNYEIDRSGVEVNLVNGYADNLTEANVIPTTSFNLMRGILRMVTGDPTTSPQVDSCAFGATPNPIRKRVWNPVVVLADNIELRDGFHSEAISPSVHNVRNALYGAVRKRITLTDHVGLVSIVRLLDIKGMGLKDTDQGSRETEQDVYQLSLVEIQALTSDADVGVFNDSVFDGGTVFGGA